MREVAFAILTSLLVLVHRRTKLRDNSFKKKNRYARQQTILGGKESNLRQARVLIVGCGGLGSSAIALLAGAGVGCLGLADFDIVDDSNLHRQFIHSERTVGKLKIESAKSFIQSLNSNVIVEMYDLRVDFENALDLVSRFDVVLDCSDNVNVRYALNDACVAHDRCLVSGAALGTSGQVAVFWASRFPERGCLRCLFKEPLRPRDRGSCAEDGVVGPIPSLIGSLQALEALKILCEWESIPSALLSMDLSTIESSSFGFIKLRRDLNCAVCGPKRQVPLHLNRVDIQKRIEPHHIVVDVRAGSSWEGADVFVTLGEIRQNPSASLSKILNSKPGRSHVLCVCDMGNSSLVAADLLLEATQGLDDDMGLKISSLKYGVKFSNT